MAWLFMHCGGSVILCSDPATVGALICERLLEQFLCKQAHERLSCLLCQSLTDLI